jgi:hypothetical protein
MRIRAPKDFWAGVMFFGFAVVAVLAARGYSLGSAGRMGPGYFPLLLGLVLGSLGAPLAIIAVAVCLFGLAIEPLGLVISLAILVTLSAWAGRQFRLLETIALALALIVFSVGVFVYALGLTLNVWPSL